MPARLGLSQGSDGAYRPTLPAEPVLHGLRSAHPPGAVLRDVPAAHVALPHPLGGLSALSRRCQNLGLAVLGMRHHVRRRTVSRLHECSMRLAASAARGIHSSRRRRRGLLVPALKQQTPPASSSRTAGGACFIPYYINHSSVVCPVMSPGSVWCMSKMTISFAPLRSQTPGQ